jgi:hypothetical protein
MSTKSNFAKKSPLKDKPLRLPGQSLDDQIWDFNYDQRLAPVMLAATCVFAAFMEIVFWLLHTSRGKSTVIMVVYALGFVLYAIWKWRRASPQLAALKLGRDGERAVAEVLAEQVRKGNAVFHDLVGPNFNLDHVIVSPQGAFVIETKTLSKPTRPDAYVTFDGTKLLVDGHAMDRDPIEQTLSEIRWLKDLLRESTGTDIPVKGLVVFPGWFVKSDHSNYDRKVWVMNPKGIDGFITAGHAVMPPDKVHLVAFHLSRYIRSSQ